MTVKVVAIMGSPHKGNSLEVTQRLEAELRRQGDVTFEYLHLRELDLQPCKGCFVCFIKGEERCPLKDDMALIRHKIDQADGVVFVSPVYSMHVSYLMKAFIDRFAYNLHRPRYHGKYALAVAVTGNIGLDPTLKYLQDVAEAMGFDCVDRLGYLAAPKNTPLRTISTRQDRTAEVAATFYRAMVTKRPKKLGFIHHLGFRLMQTSYARLEEMSPTDYRHWQERGWLDPRTRYYHDNVRGNWFLDLFARLVGWMTGRQIDKALVQAAPQEPST